MYIPEEKISEILNASDIVDIVSESVILKKSGRNFFGLCPFHAEKTPSFSVNPGKQIFHCFGCSAGGNALTYVMKYHGISFPEAAKLLARKYNITIDKIDMDPKKRRAIALKESLYRVNHKVMDFFHDQLKTSDSAAPARQYLEKRTLSSEMIDTFKLGFAPDAWETVVRLFRKEKVSKQTAEASGLILKREKKEGYYDRFRNRILFPIFDVNMQVAGFGGRVMDDAMPKYMNSPETMVYNKSRILYGLHAAKQYCRSEGEIYIVEGYFDFLSLFQHGIKNTVASLGTALTSDHIRILKGYAARMILVFDSDAAGINAAKRSLSIFAKEGVDTRVLILPDGHDPDSYMLDYGADAFRQMAASARTAMQFLLKVAMDTHGMSVQGKIKVLEEMKPHISQVQDAALRSLYVKELSETLGIDEMAVLEKIREYSAKPAQTHLRPAVENEEQTVLESDPREEQMLSMMLNYPQILEQVRAKQVLDAFYSKRLRRIGEVILSVPPQKESFVTNVMAGLEDNRDQSKVAALAMNDHFTEENIDTSALSIINRILRVRTRQGDTLTNEILTAEKGGDSDVMDLLKLKQAQIRQLHDH